MHNVDRTQLESEQEAFELGHEQGENEQFLGDILGAITGGELEVPLQESQELELASELLEVSNEQELEQFLGNVFRTVGRAAGQFVRSDTGRALGGILKDAARQALPVVGRAIGDYVSPGSGATGARLAQQAGSLLGLELEGLSPPDQEFEAARQFVRFASAAAKQAAAAPRNVAPQTAARAAVVAAAHHHAPGFAHGRVPQPAAPRPSTPHPGAAPRSATAPRSAGPQRSVAAARPAPSRPGSPHAAAPRPGGFVRPPRPTPSRAAAYTRPGIHAPGPRPWRGGGPGAVRPGQFHHRPGHPHHRRHPGHDRYPWYRGYQWPAGYPWPPSYAPTGYAPWSHAPQPAPVAPPTGYAPPPAPGPVPVPAPAPPQAAAPMAAPRRGEWGRWQRRGSVIVLYGT
jgi:hypothetical protein